MLAVRGVNARLQSKLRYNVYISPVRHLRPIYVPLLEPECVKLLKCFGNSSFLELLPLNQKLLSDVSVPVVLSGWMNLINLGQHSSDYI